MRRRSVGFVHLEAVPGRSPTMVASRTTATLIRARDARPRRLARVGCGVGAAVASAVELGRRGARRAWAVDLGRRGGANRGLGTPRHRPLSWAAAAARVGAGPGVPAARVVPARD